MTASLAKPIPATFEHAVNREKFFSRADNAVFEGYEKREQPPSNIPTESCTTNLFFGFFFDGTRNNYVKAEASKSHSNIARLYDCFPGQSVKGVLPPSTDWKYNPARYNHFFRVYIPGVASPFNEGGDTGEGLQKSLSSAVVERPGRGQGQQDRSPKHAALVRRLHAHGWRGSGHAA